MKNNIKKENNTTSIVLGLIFVSLLIFGIINYSEHQKFKNLYYEEQSAKEVAESSLQSKTREAEDLKSELNYKEKELFSLKDKLITTKDQLITTKQELEQTETLVKEQQTQIYEISKEIGKVEQRIFSLETFVSKNALLSEEIINQIHYKCGSPISIQNNICYIDTCKMGKDMKECLKFKWTDDLATSGDYQSLFDVWAFWSSKKGDCDDFAFFTAAWLRYEIENAPCSSVVVWMRNRDGWSCGTTTKLFWADKDKVYDVCGCFSSGGCHCEVGYYGGTLNNPYTIGFFNEMYLFEPQNGEYTGLSTTEFNRGIGWLFAYDDYYDVDLNTNKVTNSLKSLKEDLNKL